MTPKGEMVGLITWMMVGGGIIFSFGMSIALARIDGIEKGMLAKPIAYIGLGLVGLGVGLGSYWEIFW